MVVVLETRRYVGSSLGHSRNHFFVPFSSVKRIDSAKTVQAKSFSGNFLLTFFSSDLTLSGLQAAPAPCFDRYTGNVLGTDNHPDRLVCPFSGDLFTFEYQYFLRRYSIPAFRINSRYGCVGCHGYRRNDASGRHPTSRQPSDPIGNGYCSGSGYRFD